jgi:hypothetical protein
MLAARRRSPPASPFANLADALCSFVQNEFPFWPALEFLGLLGLALGQPRNLIVPIFSLVMD